MKFFIIFGLICVCSAIPYHPQGYVNTGQSSVQRSEDGYGNYAFGYNEDHATGGTFRKEKGGPGFQVGSYGLRDTDGRIRIVNYVADALGFRATVSTNEPGTDPKQDPAATEMTFGHAYTPMLMAPAIHAPMYVAPPPVSYYAPEPMYAKSMPHQDLQMAPYTLSSHSSQDIHIPSPHHASVAAANHYLPEPQYLASSPYGQY